MEDRLWLPPPMVDNSVFVDISCEIEKNSRFRSFVLAKDS